MSIEAKIKSYDDIKNLFPSRLDFKITGIPFEKQRSMTFRVLNQMRQIFLMGPAPGAKILTMDEDWDRSAPGCMLNDVKKKMLEKKVYGFVTYLEGEGTTIWCLTPDNLLVDPERLQVNVKPIEPKEAKKPIDSKEAKDSFVYSSEKKRDFNLHLRRANKSMLVVEKDPDNNKDIDLGEPPFRMKNTTHLPKIDPVPDKEDSKDDNKDDKNKENKSDPLGPLARFNNIVKKYIKGKQWMTAFNEAKKAMGDNNQEPPFAISFVASVTLKPMPFFGKVAWGIALKNDVISLIKNPVCNKTPRRDHSKTFSDTS